MAAFIADRLRKSDLCQRFFAFDKTIDLADVAITLMPVFCAAFEDNTEMWRIGADEFTAPKISRIERHLEEGGEVWIRTDDQDNRNAAVIRHGGDEHLRTHKSGCILSARPNGEGDLDAISALNRDRRVYFARDNVPHDELLTVDSYRLIRSTAELAAASDEASVSVFQQASDVACGTSWIGVMSLGFTKTPGPAFVKIPSVLLMLAVLVRAVGVGIMTPVASVLRAGWIVIRTLIDPLTNSGGRRTAGIGHSCVPCVGRCMW